MASDFDSCGFGAISPELILRSLIGCVDNLAGTYTQAVLRVELHSEAMTSPVHCASFEDFQINLRRCLDMALDGHVTLRVNVFSRSVDTCGLCANAATWYDYLNSLFGEDENGLLYLNVYQTNSAPE